MASYHRQASEQIKLSNELKKLETDLSFIQMSKRPPHEQKMTFHLNFKKINFQDIDCTRDHVLIGYYLNVRIVDIPMTGFASVHFIIEDELGVTIFLSVYNLGTDYEKIKKNYDVGTKLQIFNPYIRFAYDGYIRIRIDDIKSIMFAGKVNKICRYCGDEDSKFSCGNCKIALYCSKECQSKDWKQAGHKSICNSQ